MEAGMIATLIAAVTVTPIKEVRVFGALSHALQMMATVITVTRIRETECALPGRSAARLAGRAKPGAATDVAFGWIAAAARSLSSGAEVGADPPIGSHGRSGPCRAHLMTGAGII